MFVKIFTDVPGALFQENIARRADMDMYAKIREDPLYQIRQKEEDSRKRLLQNPIKMKQLQKLVITCAYTYMYMYVTGRLSPFFVRSYVL